MALVKLNNRGVRSATTFGSISALGEMRFIKKQTASSSATISFVDGTSDVVLDNTYKEYLFTFNNIHPATDNADFTFNMSVDSGSNYNVTKTTTVATAQHSEAGSDTDFAYVTADDLAQGTGFQIILGLIGNDADQCTAGELTIYSPTSTTYVKHWMSRFQTAHYENYTQEMQHGGYINDAANDISHIKFALSSGDFAGGTVKMWGVK